MAIKRSAESADLYTPPSAPPPKKQHVNGDGTDEKASLIALASLSLSSSSSSLEALSASGASLLPMPVASSLPSLDLPIDQLLTSLFHNSPQKNQDQFKSAIQNILNHPQWINIPTEQAKKLLDFIQRHLTIDTGLLSILAKFFTKCPHVSFEDTEISVNFLAGLDSLWHMLFYNALKVLPENGEKNKQNFITIFKALPDSLLIDLYKRNTESWSAYNGPTTCWSLGVYMVETPEIYSRIPAKTHNLIILDDSLSLKAFKTIVFDSRTHCNIDDSILKSFLERTSGSSDPTTTAKRCCIIQHRPDLLEFAQQALMQQQMRTFIQGLSDKTVTPISTSLQKLKANPLFEPRLIGCIAESLGIKKKSKAQQNLLPVDKLYF